MHGLQLEMSLRQNYFVWDNPKTSMNHLLTSCTRQQGRAAIKASKQELIIEAVSSTVLNCDCLDGCDREMLAHAWYHRCCPVIFQTLTLEFCYSKMASRAWYQAQLLMALVYRLVIPWWILLPAIANQSLKNSGRWHLVLNGWNGVFLWTWSNFSNIDYYDLLVHAFTVLCRYKLNTRYLVLTSPYMLDSYSFNSYKLYRLAALSLRHNVKSTLYVGEHI